MNELELCRKREHRAARRRVTRPINMRSNHARSQDQRVEARIIYTPADPLVANPGILSRCKSKIKTWLNFGLRVSRP